MKEIDSYSYHLGAADCFCEMVAAGVKNIALSHPCDSRQLRDSFLEDFQKLCDKYHIHFYPEDDPFLTDLFPISNNKDKYNVIFYQDEGQLKAYLDLKAEKKRLTDINCYQGAERRQLAIAYGKLLSYSDEGIKRLLSGNNDKE